MPLSAVQVLVEINRKKKNNNKAKWCVKFFNEQEGQSS